MQVIGGKKVKGRVLVLWTIGTIFFGWQMSGLLSAEQPMDVKEFVRRIFIEGVPYEEARKYGPTDVPTLLKMLADPKEEAYRTNIVVTLGIIGDERAVDPLIAFLGQDVHPTPSIGVRRPSTQPKRTDYMGNPRSSNPASGPRSGRQPQGPRSV